MTDKQQPPHKTGPQNVPDGPAPRKPYVPPRVVSHNALEVITGACSPTPPGKADTVACTLGQS